jgi:hypothetical protein
VHRRWPGCWLGWLGQHGLQGLMRAASLAYRRLRKMRAPSRKHSGSWHSNGERRAVWGTGVVPQHSSRACVAADQAALLLPAASWCLLVISSERNGPFTERQQHLQQRWLGAMSKVANSNALCVEPMHGASCLVRCDGISVQSCAA